MHLADEKLLAQLRAGEPAAVRTWFSQYHDKLFRWVSQKISNDKDVEEVVQDTFMSCLKHLPLFRGESGIWTWMARVAHHEVADYYRKRYAKKFIQALPLHEFLGLEEVVDAHEVSVKVKDVLKKMTSESREILQLKYIDKKKVKDIAREMGKSVKSIESLLFRARLEFRELYGTEEGELPVLLEDEE
jgi:RNA polymerase sigma-70 factor (ECF subfamily)